MALFLRVGRQRDGHAFERVGLGGVGVGRHHVALRVADVIRARFPRVVVGENVLGDAVAMRVVPEFQMLSVALHATDFGNLAIHTPYDFIDALGRVVDELAELRIAVVVDGVDRRHIAVERALVFDIARHRRVLHSVVDMVQSVAHRLVDVAREAAVVVIREIVEDRPHRIVPLERQDVTVCIVAVLRAINRVLVFGLPAGWSKIRESLRLSDAVELIVPVGHAEHAGHRAGHPVRIVFFPEVGHHGRYVSVVQIMSRVAQVAARNRCKRLLGSNGGVVL